MKKSTMSKRILSVSLALMLGFLSFFTDVKAAELIDEQAPEIYESSSDKVIDGDEKDVDEDTTASEAADDNQEKADIFNEAETEPDASLEEILPESEEDIFSDEKVTEDNLSDDEAEEIEEKVPELGGMLSGKYGNFYYLYDDTSSTPRLTLSKSGTYAEIALQGTDTEYPWDSVRDNIKEIEFQNIDRISDDAFSGMEKLTRLINIAGIDIGDRAFKDCPSLYSFQKNQNNINSNETVSVGKEAFKGCNSSYGLYNIDVLLDCDKLTDIGESAFEGSVVFSDKSIELPKSIKSIGKNAFANCPKLKSVTIDENATGVVIGSRAFYNNANMTVFKYKGDDITIADDAFAGCSSVVIHCQMGSNLAKWCATKGLETYLYKDVSPDKIVVPAAQMETTFPDNEMRRFALSYDANDDGNLDAEEISNVPTTVDLSRINDFTGISVFDGIEKITATNNNYLTKAVINDLPNLTSVELSKCNNLAAIDLTGCSALVKLTAQCTSLIDLKVDENAPKNIAIDLDYSAFLVASGKDLLYSALPEGFIARMSNLSGIEKDSENSLIHIIGSKSITKGETIYSRTSYSGGSFDYLLDNGQSVTLYIGLMEYASPKPLNGAYISIYVENQVYTGTALEPKPIIKYGYRIGDIRELVEGDDYYLTYSNNIEPGEATVTIHGQYKYYDDETPLSFTFKIYPSAISMEYDDDKDAFVISNAEQFKIFEKICNETISASDYSLLKSGTDVVYDGDVSKTAILACDIDMGTEGVSFVKSAIVDLNNHEFKAKNSHAFELRGNSDTDALIVKNGTVIGTAVNPDGSGIFEVYEGTMNIESCMIKDIDSGDVAGPAVQNYNGVLNMDNCIMDELNCLGVEMTQGVKTTLTDCNMRSFKKGHLIWVYGGDLVINGGEYVSKAGAVYGDNNKSRSGSITINGANITGYASINLENDGTYFIYPDYSRVNSRQAAVYAGGFPFEMNGGTIIGGNAAVYATRDVVITDCDLKSYEGYGDSWVSAGLYIKYKQGCTYSLTGGTYTAVGKIALGILCSSDDGFNLAKPGISVSELLGDDAHFVGSVDQTLHYTSKDVRIKLDNMFDVYFDLNGSELEDTGEPMLSGKERIEVLKGNVYGALPTASVYGYVFAGWYDAPGSKKINPDGSETDAVQITSETIFSQSGDQTLYAHWTPETYTVSFDFNKPGIENRNFPIQRGKSVDEYIASQGLTWKSILNNPVQNYEWIHVIDGANTLYNTAKPVMSDLTITTNWITPEKLSNPVANYETLTKLEEGTVIILRGSLGAKVYYTLDGTTPDNASNLYTDSFAINSEMGEDAIIDGQTVRKVTLKVVAIREGYTDSDVITYEYFIDSPLSNSDFVADMAAEGYSLATVPKGLWIHITDENPTYSSYAIKPSFRAYYGKKPVEASDYRVTYKNNINVSTFSNPAQLIVTFTGRYSGKITTDFQIMPLALDASESVIVEGTSAQYQGKVITPQFVVRDGKQTLKNNKDYVVTLLGVETGDAMLDTAVTANGISYKPVTDNAVCDAEGTYIYEIAGVGNYSGSRYVRFAVENAIPLADVKITSVSTQKYTGSPIEITAYDPASNTGGAFRVLYNGKTLRCGTAEEAAADSSIACFISGYENNTAMGTATVTLMASDNSDPAFFGTKTFNFSITGTPMSSVQVYEDGKKANRTLNNVIYGAGTSILLNGEGVPVQGTKGICHTPNNSNIVLKCGDTVLTENVDYTVAYKNNDHIGVATVSYTGIGEYTGSISRSYKITAGKISNLPILVSPEVPAEECLELTYAAINADSDEDGLAEAPYSKSGAKIVPDAVEVNINVGSAEAPSYVSCGLVLGKDYKLSYSNNKKRSGNARMIITGIGNYSGKLTVPYEIVAADGFEGVTISASDVIFKNRKNAFKSNPVLKDGSTTLKKGSEYTDIVYTYAERTWLNDTTVRDKDEPVLAGDIPKAGTFINVTVTGCGSYGTSKSTGEAPKLTASYRVLTATLNSAAVSVASQSYRGINVVPSKNDIKVKVGKCLLDASDFEIVSVTNNDRPGYGKVTLRGCGAYGGSKTVRFKIVKDDGASDGIFVSAKGNDSNSGTKQSPLKTVQAALNVAHAGDTIYIREGTYTGKNIFVNSGNASDGYITVTNYPNEKAELTLASGTNGAVFDLNGEDYIIIEGLKIGNLTGKNVYGILMPEGTQNVIVRNNEIYKIKTNAPDNAVGEANGILMYGTGTTADLAIKNITIKNNTVHDNVNGWSENISASGNCENVNIQNNKVYNNTNIGIDFYGNNDDGYCPTASINRPRNCSATGNIVYNCKSSYAECAGIYVDGAQDITVSGNEVYNNMYGIEIGSEEWRYYYTNDYRVCHITVSNNNIHNNPAGGIRIGGYTGDGDDAYEDGELKLTGWVVDSEISGNTLNNNGSGDDGYNGEINFSKCDNILVKNNIITQSSDKYPVYEYGLNSEYATNIILTGNKRNGILQNTLPD